MSWGPPLLVEEQVHAVAVNVREEGNKIMKAASQPVHGPRHDYVEPPSRRVLLRSVECWWKDRSGAAAVAVGDCEERRGHLRTKR